MKFTPEVLLSAPRRSAGVPNSKGTLVLYTQQAYDFQTHRKDIAFRCLDVETGQILDIVKDRDVKGVNWLDDEEFVFLQGQKNGDGEETGVFIGRIERSTTGKGSACHVYQAGTIGAPASDLKISKNMTSEGSSRFTIVFSAQAAPDGSLLNPQSVTSTRSSGRLYSSLFVRHWDHYTTKAKNALFTTELYKDGEQGRYRLAGPIVNILHGSQGLECPIPPFGGVDHFDVGAGCVFFVAKDPNLDPSMNTKCNVYLVRLGSKPLVREKIHIPGFEGQCTSPIISPDGSRAAFLAMRRNGYEADRNEIFTVSLEGALQPAKRVFIRGEGVDHSWVRSPSSIRFTANGKSLVAVAEEMGDVKAFLVNLHTADQADVKTLIERGSVSSVVPLQDGKILISGSTLVDNSFFSLLDCSGRIIWTNSNADEGHLFGLASSQITSMWTPASNPNINQKIYSFVFRPSTFERGKKYPVAYIIHAGPQASWTNGWSTRWNLAVFAEQGYIVVAPNPTGSTGYGQAFTDSITGEYGGDVYQDIVNCFEWVGANIPEADNERAVALGFSFGGYMINWIQGHELGRRFKALVCHDGTLSVPGLLATDELFAQFNDHGGTPWMQQSTDARTGAESKALQAQQNFRSSTMSDWQRWSPSEHFENWATPQLIMHNAKDYRVPIAEGLAAFNILRARGVESQFLTFPDENHWTLKPENALVWHKVVLNWINRHVGLPPYTTESPESDAFWGGTIDEDGEATDMVELGHQEV